jgi:endonuclease III
MSGPNRSALISKVYKVLKQHYKPVAHAADRPLLELMLFGCCLENAHLEKAEKTYESLVSSFFDWNEVRVSTVNELSETMKDLPDPAMAAANLKCILQTVFEANYSFDLEPLKKQNLGVAIKRLEKLEGATPFVVALATQHALSGHFIPLDRGTLEVLYIVGIATEAERQSASVAGLERAIPKSKGIEFGSLLHQLAADFVANPLSPTVKSILVAINPEAKDRLPKRGQKKFSLAKTVEAVNDGKASAPAAGGKSEGKPGDKGGAEKGSRDSRPGDRKATHKEPPNDTKKHATVKAEELPAGKRKLPPQKGTSAKPAAKGERHAGQKVAVKQLAKRKPR